MTNDSNFLKAVKAVEGMQRKIVRATPDQQGASMETEGIMETFAAAGIAIDIEEFGDELQDRVATSILGMAIGETHISPALAGMWFDGILTGYKLAEIDAAERVTP